MQHAGEVENYKILHLKILKRWDHFIEGAERWIVISDSVYVRMGEMVLLLFVAEW